MDATTAELTVRMLVGLAVVGGLLYGLTRFAASRLDGARPSATIAVEARESLTKGSAVALVTIGRRTMLLGVTDSSVSLLAEGDDLAERDEGPQTGTDADAEAEADQADDTVVDVRSTADGPSFLDALRAVAAQRGRG